MAINDEHALDLVKYSMHKSALQGRDSGKRYKCKSRAFVTPSTIINFFGSVRPFKKCHIVQIGFIKNLVLMIAKIYMPLSIVKNP
jgi:hypothetical protein